MRMRGNYHWDHIPISYTQKASLYVVEPVGASVAQNWTKSIREYGSTLYVGLARAVSPTNTNFRLTFLLTRLQEALYEDLAV